MNEYRNINKLQNWDKNPRSISKTGFQRLKKQIQKLGQYKPLIITKDGTVLGGNMLEEGSTVEDALEAAEFDTEDSCRVRLNGKAAELDDEVEDGDRITVAGKIKGGK